MTNAVSSGALWGALSAVVGFITDKTGIKVLRGAASGTASTNKRSVTIPRLPEGMLSFREYVKTIAFLYHESAHIRYSNFSLSANNALHKAVTGVLEDIRIEKLAMLSFPAARKYLSELVRIMTEDGEKTGYGFPALKEEMSEAKVLQLYMLYRLRHDLLRQEGVKPALDSAIAVAEKKFPRGMMVRLNAMMFQVDNCDNEDDVFELASEICKMIKEEKEKKENSPPPQQQESGNDQSQQAGGSGEDQGNPSSTGEQGSDGNSKSKSGKKSKGKSKDGEEGGSTNSSQSSNGAGGAGSLEELLNMTDDQIVQSVGDMLGNELNEMSAQHQRAGTGATMPNVHPLKLKEAAVDMVSLKGAVNATRTKTLNWLASAAQSDLQRDRKGLLIDPTQLAMARVGGEIFAEESEGIDINCAISIVIDRSTSMSHLIKPAVNAALATALAYDVQGIETQVSVFPVYQHDSSGATDEGVGVVKRWGEKPRVLASRINSLGVNGGTPMAEAVMFAAADILRRDETLKLVIVVTDGEPNNEEATKSAIEAARRAGIVVTGLGIGVDPSKVFGEKFAGCLMDINQLSGVMTRLVKSAMK